MHHPWVRFNTVGIVGFVVQLLVLAGLLRLGVHYVLATFVAVEAAVVQNFVWHEQWTWPERSAVESWGHRLWRFHMLNGLVSIIGNVVLMRLLVGVAEVPAVLANAVAVVVCSTINFATARRFVWVTGACDGPSDGD